MDEEELAVFQNPPERIRVHRGVAVHRNPDRILWTQELKTTQWFVQRFDSYKLQDYVRTGMIEKNIYLLILMIGEKKKLKSFGII